MNTAAVIVVIAHQSRITAADLVEDEVHVVAAAQGKGRIAPLRHHRGIREFQIQHAPHISPDRTGTALLLVVIFDQGRGHIDTEAIAAVGQPEAHDVFEGLPGRHRGRIAITLLPGLSHIEKAVIEGGLALKEVQNIAPAAFALTTDIGKAGSALKTIICPYKAVGKLVFLYFLALCKPGVFF